MFPGQHETTRRSIRAFRIRRRERPRCHRTSGSFRPQWFAPDRSRLRGGVTSRNRSRKRRARVLTRNCRIFCNGQWPPVARGPRLPFGSSTNVPVSRTSQRQDGQDQQRRSCRGHHGNDGAHQSPCRGSLCNVISSFIRNSVAQATTNWARIFCPDGIIDQLADDEGEDEVERRTVLERPVSGDAKKEQQDEVHNQRADADSERIHSAYVSHSGASVRSSSLGSCFPAVSICRCAAASWSTSAFCAGSAHFRRITLTDPSSSTSASRTSRRS